MSIYMLYEYDIFPYLMLGCYSSSGQEHSSSREPPGGLEVRALTSAGKQRVRVLLLGLFCVGLVVWGVLFVWFYGGFWGGFFGGVFWGFFWWVFLGFFGGVLGVFFGGVFCFSLVGFWGFFWWGFLGFFWWGFFGFCFCFLAGP